MVKKIKVVNNEGEDGNSFHSAEMGAIYEVLAEDVGGNKGWMKIELLTKNKNKYTQVLMPHHYELVK